MIEANSGAMPIIRRPKGNAAEMISQRLDQKLRDYFTNSRVTSNYAYSTSYQERPGIADRYVSRTVLTIVVIILDRNLDLIPMISHSWTVQSPLLIKF